MKTFPSFPYDLDCRPPAEAHSGQIYSCLDKLSNGATRSVVLVLGSNRNDPAGSWIVSSIESIEINRFFIPFYHYRDIVFNNTGKWPESDVLCDIERAVLEYTVPTGGLIAHVADYNYAPFVLFHGADDKITKMRLPENAIAPLGVPDA